MIIAFIGDKEVKKDKIENIFKEVGASSLMLFPSGDVEDIATEIAKEVGVPVMYDSYASGSYIGGVKTLVKNISKGKGKLFIAAHSNDTSPKVEMIPEEANKQKVSYQFI